MFKRPLEEIGYINSPEGEKLTLLRGFNLEIATEFHYNSMQSSERDDERIFSTPGRAYNAIHNLGKRSLFLSLVSESEGMVGSAWLMQNPKTSDKVMLVPGVRVYNEAYRGHGIGTFLANKLHYIVDTEQPVKLSFTTGSTNQFAFQLASSQGYRLDDHSDTTVGYIKMLRPKMPKRSH